MSKVTFSCELCSFSTKGYRGSWRRHLLEEGHQRQARKRSENMKTGEKQRCAVVFGLDDLPRNEVLQFFSSQWLVTDFVFWNDRPHFCIVEFLTRDFCHIAGSTQSLLGKEVVIRSRDEISDIEWRSIRPLSVSMDISSGPSALISSTGSGETDVGVSVEDSSNGEVRTEPQEAAVLSPPSKRFRVDSDLDNTTEVMGHVDISRISTILTMPNLKIGLVPQDETNPAGEGMAVDVSVEQAQGRTEDKEDASSAVAGPSGTGGTKIDLVSPVDEVEREDVEAVTVKVEDSLERNSVTLSGVSSVQAVGKKGVAQGKSAGTPEASSTSSSHQRMTGGLMDVSTMTGNTEGGSQNIGDPYDSAGLMGTRRRIRRIGSSWLQQNINVGEDRRPTKVEIVEEDRIFTNENERSHNLRGHEFLNDIQLKDLLKKNLNVESLDIHDCPLLTTEAVDIINNYGRNLRVLTIGNIAGQMFNSGKKKFSGPEALEKLVMWNVDLSKSRSGFLDSIANYSATLTWLDISGTENIKCFEFLTSLVNLEGLVLYKVNLKRCEDPDYSDEERKSKKNRNFSQIVDRLSNKIRHLDISCSLKNFGTPNVLLGKIVSRLPDLQYLDISETNLAGTVGGGKRNRDSCSIPGLEGRVNRPLEYLGLYKTLNDACERDSIPAKSIGGDKDETQTLAAVRAHIDHHELLEKVLRDYLLVSNFAHNDQGTRSLDSLELILLAMDRNREKKGVQLLGSACLFYIAMKHKGSKMLTVAVKQKILCAMNVENPGWKVMPREEFTAFLYEEFTKILFGCLNIEKDNEANTGHSNIERIAVDILSLLSFYCDREQRKIARKLGVVQKMLSVISNCLGGNGYEDTMDSAWLVLLNATCHTPENRRIFLECDGLAVYFRYHKDFSWRRKSLVRMTGLMGNVAEEASLRVYLMTEPLISIHYGLLGNTQNKISEVAFFAAEFLVSILCDDEKSWKVGKPCRVDVRKRLRTQIQKWDKKNTTSLGDYATYKSLSPFLCVLKVQHTIECKLWAAWVLANYTKFEPEKYVRKIEEKEGILEELRWCEAHEDPEFPELAVYARRVLENVAEFNGAV